MPVTSTQPLPDRFEEPRALEEVLPAGARPGARRPARLRLPRLLAEDRRQHLRAPRLAGPEQDPRPVPAEEAPEGNQRLRLGRPHRVPGAGPARRCATASRRTRSTCTSAASPTRSCSRSSSRTRTTSPSSSTSSARSSTRRRLAGQRVLHAGPQSRRAQDPLVRGAVFLGNRKVELRSFPDPTPGPGEVVIQMKASGMCGSDLKFYRSPPGRRRSRSALGI